jgi:hypothetical protein
MENRERRGKSVRNLWVLLGLLVLGGCQDPSATVENPAPDPYASTASADIEQTKAEHEGDDERLYALMKNQDFSKALDYATRINKRFPNDELVPQARYISSLMLSGAATTQSVVSDRIIETTDKFTGVTFYNHKLRGLLQDMSLHMADTDFYFGDPLNVYVAARDGTPHLCIEVTYTSSAWLFPNGVIVLADNTRFERYGLDFIDQRSTIADSDMRLSEKAHWEATVRDVEMLQAISSASLSQLRICGRSDNRDFYLTAYDKLMVQDMLTTFTSLGGQLPKEN